MRGTGVGLQQSYSVVPPKCPLNSLDLFVSHRPSTIEACGDRDKQVATLTQEADGEAIIVVSCFPLLYSLAVQLHFLVSAYYVHV